MRNFLITMLASTAIFAGTASAGEVFIDEFDSPSLDGKWTILRPADSNFAVENGQLLLISSKPGSLSDNTVENVLMPNVDLPGGNWTMTVDFSGEFQTAHEELGIGVMDTETSYLTAGIVTLGDQYYFWSLSAQMGG